MNIFCAVIGFILGIGLLVIVHELGHFYVARLFNVRVLRFSIGFGPSKPIWYDKLGTEYVISAIPLGGYIKLLDTLEFNKDIDQRMAMDKKSPLIRMLIFLAGPISSILFAVLLYWVVFMMGISIMVPILGTIHKGTSADLAKLKSGFEIIKINDQVIHDWEEVASTLIDNFRKKNKLVTLEAYDRKTTKHSIHTLSLNNLNINDNKGDLLITLGLEPLQLVESSISEVVPKHPASEAGIKSGDIIISVDNLPMKDGAEVSEYIHKKAEQKIKLKIKRNKKILDFVVVPIRKTSFSGEKIGLIGIKYHNKPYPKEWFKIRKYGVVDSFYKAVVKTYNYTKLSGYILYETIIGKMSLKNMAGPIAIGYYAGQSIQSGLEYFLSFLGVISIGLGVLNLLPVPWLDGGSVAHCMYEGLVGKPAPQKAVMLARAFGLVFLVLLTILVFVNDLARF
ncbi:MAG: RIP metalloprotease RseP [Gammaproteobacteria bacterium]|jgi:regulator of sigma E protease